MNKYILILVALFTITGNLYAAESEDLEKGVTAYKEADYKTAFKLLKPLAEKEHAEAQFYLARMYYAGKGVTKDIEEAYKWFKALGDNKKVSPDDNEFVKRYRKAAEQGDVEAQLMLGVVYPDNKEAAKWYSKAAEQGDALGQVFFAVMYAKGDGVKQDNKEASKWFRKAAEQGDALGQMALAGMYKNGMGVIKDYQEAVKWVRKAAEQGSALGQISLAGMYKNGEGVKKNYVLAHMWFNIAAANGAESSKENRDIVEKEMSSADIERAQTLARECMESEYKNCAE